MSRSNWLIAIGVTSTTAAIFIVAMVGFFRSRPGRTPLRLLLLTSVFSGLTAILVTLARQQTVGPVALFLGTTFAVGAQVLFWGAVRAHGNNRPSAAFANAAPTVVIDTGPYAWVRHPFYCAYILGFAAGAVFTGRWQMGCVALGVSAVYALAARQEEQVILTSQFGATYREYRERVGGFLPRVPRQRAGTMPRQAIWCGHEEERAEAPDATSRRS